MPVPEDGWSFNLIYIITFGGFIGLSNFLPTFFYEQFGVTKVEAGRLTMLAALMGSGIRVVGGYFADRLGGILVLSVVLLAAVGSFLLLTATPSLALTTALFMLCFAALGAGNGALFQLVPLRWPANTAVAGSMIGEVGALGGAILPNVMGLSKQYTGSFAYGSSATRSSRRWCWSASGLAAQMGRHLGRAARQGAGAGYTASEGAGRLGPVAA